MLVNLIFLISLLLLIVVQKDRYALLATYFVQSLDLEHLITSLDPHNICTVSPS